MKSFAEIEKWIAGARKEYCDPSIPVGQIFARFSDGAGSELIYSGGDVICRMESESSLALWLGRALPVPIAISKDGAPQLAGERLAAFGIVRIAPGLWALHPSLNVPNLIHAFVVIYGVPSPAPWEK